MMASNGVTGAISDVTVNLKQASAAKTSIGTFVKVEAGHAQVWMRADDPATLDALQNNSGQLREMLSSQGFAQGRVDISQRSFQRRLRVDEIRAA